MLLALLLWLHGPSVARASTERDLRQLTDWLVGVWDNDNQIRFEGLGYLEGLEAVPETDRHTRMRVFLQRIDLPWLSDHVFYLEHYAGSLDRPYRQHILRFTLESQTIYQDSFQIAKPERLVGAWNDLAKLEQIAEADRGRSDDRNRPGAAQQRRGTERRLDDGTLRSGL